MTLKLLPRNKRFIFEGLESLTAFVFVRDRCTEGLSKSSDATRGISGNTLYRGRACGDTVSISKSRPGFLHSPTCTLCPRYNYGQNVARRLAAHLEHSTNMGNKELTSVPFVVSKTCCGIISWLCLLTESGLTAKLPNLRSMQRSPR